MIQPIAGYRNLTAEEIALINEIKAHAEQRGREHAAKILADQAAHAQFWRNYEAGRIVLTVPGYEGMR